MGAASHRYLAYVNHCLVESFDEAWIPTLLSATENTAREFLPLRGLPQGEERNYPSKSLERVRRRCGDHTYLFGLPLLLNVTILGVDLKFIERGLEYARDRLAPQLANSDGASIWGRLQPDDKHMPLIEHLQMLADPGVKGRAPLRFVEWAWAVRAAACAQSSHTEPLMSMTLLSDETLVCFMLGFLFSELAIHSQQVVNWRRFAKNREGETSNADAGRETIFSRLSELHYAACLLGGIQVENYDGESPRVSDKPMRLEWFSTYRQGFGTDVPARRGQHYYYLVSPEDMTHFSGDWYLGIRKGSVSADLGRDVILFVTGDKGLRSHIQDRGIGVPPLGDQHASYMHVASSQYRKSTLEKYRFDIPARRLWEQAISHSDLSGYGSIATELAAGFEKILEVINTSAVNMPGMSIVPSSRTDIDRHTSGETIELLRELADLLVSTISQASSE